MRKSDPDKVRDDFVEEVDRLRGFFNRMSSLLEGQQHEMADNSQLAQTVFLSTYVAFENFWSDLFLAYLNIDPTQYQREFNRRIEQSVKERYSGWHAGRVDFSVRKHIKKDKIEHIVDPNRRNLTFKDAEKMKKRAGKWLNPVHASKIKSIDDADERAMDAANAIRNFITHKSTESKQNMNDHLNNVEKGGHNVGLGRGTQRIHNVGAFLKAYKNGDRRVILYQNRIRSITDSVV
jgi:hypothetical protein